MFMRKNGMTLVEVIVSIAILGIIAVSFLAVFTSAYKYIFSAGRKSIAVSQVEKNVESKLAIGSSVATESILLNFGSVSAQINGETVTMNQSFDNGARLVSIVTFVPQNSIVSGSAVTPVENKLEISASDLELLVGSTYKLETNKNATFVTSNSSIVTVDSSGLITAVQSGTATITVTPTSTTYPNDERQCFVTVTSEMKIVNVPGGMYVNFNGVKYQKLDGLNGRVLKMGPISGDTYKWNTGYDLPTKEEMSSILWTSSPSLRVRLYNSAPKEYWTYTSQGTDNQRAVTFVNTAGDFQTVNMNINANNVTKFVFEATSLDVNLVVKSGSGTESNPYNLELP